MENWKTPQEKFWAETFGKEYIERNNSRNLHAANLNLFSKIATNFSIQPKTVFELGANIGMNIRALSELLPGSEFSAIEINPTACTELRKLNCQVYEGSILEFQTQKKFDLVFTKGVLIHLNPDEINKVYDLMYEISTKYLIVAEYYNPSPVSVTYRGETDRLFKRDFAGDMLDKFPNLKLIDYGFCYHKGPFPQDDITWFLMEKMND